jgi:hypothetical protein
LGIISAQLAAFLSLLNSKAALLLAFVLWRNTCIAWQKVTERAMGVNI